MGTFGQAVKQIAAEQGITHEQLGFLTCDERSSVTKKLNGDRPITRHFIQQTTNALKDPKLYMEGIGELYNGVFYFPYLDGDDIDLSIRGIEEKLEEEMAEIEAIIDSRPKGKKEESIYKDQDLAKREAAETIDCIHCFMNKLIKICENGSLDIADCFQQHTEKLIKSGYIKKAPSFATAKG